MPRAGSVMNGINQQPVNATMTDDGGGGNLFALLCGPFCKGTPFEEMLGLNEQNQPQPNGNISNVHPITSQGETKK